MFSVIECPSCELKVRLPESAIGKTVRCPQCNNTFVGEAKSSEKETSDAPPPPPPPRRKDPSDEYEVVGTAKSTTNARRSPPRDDRDEDEDRRSSRRSRDEDDDDDDRPRRRTSARDRDRDRDDDRPRRRTSARDDYDDDYADEIRKKRRKRKKSGNTGLIIFGVAGILLAAAGAIFLVIWGLNSLFDKSISESDWVTVEVPGRFKGKLPGKYQEKSQNIMGLTQKMWVTEQSKDAVYVISMMEGELPAHRRNLPVETLLNDSCDGAVNNTPGGSEVSRKSITKGKIQGKELVISVPKGKGKMIAEVYIVNGRLYMLLAGGKGFEPGDKNVRQFFDYFEILEQPK